MADNKAKQRCGFCNEFDCGGWHFKYQSRYAAARNDADLFIKAIDQKCGKNHLIKTDIEFIHPKCEFKAILLRKTFKEGYQAAMDDLQGVVRKEKERRAHELLGG